jgi:hypothetical protein
MGGLLPVWGKPDDIPTGASGVYADSGWMSWSDWLGTNAPRRSKRKQQRPRRPASRQTAGPFASAPGARVPSASRNVVVNWGEHRQLGALGLASALAVRARDTT